MELALGETEEGKVTAPIWDSKGELHLGMYYTYGVTMGLGLILEIALLPQSAFTCIITLQSGAVSLGDFSEIEL